MFKHLLIATDGSDLSQKAVEQGLALAKALGAKVTAVYRDGAFWSVGSCRSVDSVL